MVNLLDLQKEMIKKLLSFERAHQVISYIMTKTSNKYKL